jgi:leader peptidase (prepilin peptidase)/N-methyltransferase
MRGVTFALPAVLVDVAVQRLPDVLTWPCLAGVVVLSLAQAAASGSTAAGVRTIVAGAVVAGAFLVLALFAGVGIGDAKLAAGLAVVLSYVSWGAVVAGIAAGFCIAGLQAAAVLLIQRRGVAARIPLGPALLAGAFLALVATRR